MIRSAKLSEDGMYRWLLFRGWDPTAPTITWVMANPSTADAEKDDPTLRRIMKFSKAWGYGGLQVVNLFPFRSSSPSRCKEWFKNQPSGSVALKTNLKHIYSSVDSTFTTLLAWGAAGDLYPAHTRILVHDLQDKAYCLGVTKNGQPKHPLARGTHRIPDDFEPIRFTQFLNRW